jgi:hypothetical protein
VVEIDGRAVYLTEQEPAEFLHKKRGQEMPSGHARRGRWAEGPKLSGRALMLAAQGPSPVPSQRAYSTRVRHRGERTELCGPASQDCGRETRAPYVPATRSRS